ncbi:RluA family pseudouridine synthase [Listeria costaricensis]|uniref:RluA family pseudouridine synthase n=1 Tax=Listeria costaricensis TaxID=2026604 RepID=UPI000C0709AB|nr:RluA family pseudouridine synthase [Listeria costaricensis]
MYFIEIPIIPSFAAKTIQDLLADQFHLGKKARHEYRMSKSVLLDNQPVSLEQEVVSGQKLQLPLLNELTPSPASGPLDVLYEDDFIALVSKPAGLKTHPNSSSDHDTAVNRLQHYFIQTEKPSASAYHVHRLDQVTSGLVLFAKNRLALAAFSYQLEKRTIKRSYIALVEGKITEQQTIDKPIGKDRHISGKQHISTGGQQATTHLTPLDYLAATNQTLVSCELETGRTHQIRVHLASIGHPIVGDKLYGSKVRQKRVMLHAARIDFYHPFFDTIVTKEAHLPTDW